MAQLKSQRDAPGTMREYETVYILKADATTDSIQEVNNRIRKVIEDRAGKVIRVDNWGKRKLAYEVKKQLKGIYLYWLYLGQSDLVAELERNLRMLDLVIRFNSVIVDRDVFPDARPTQMNEDAFVAAATTVPDEEDAYMGRGASDEEGGEGGEEFEAGAVGTSAKDGEVAAEPAAELIAATPAEPTEPTEPTATATEPTATADAEEEK